MPAGTIALTNGSNAVSGTGTSFTTELKQGDFVYVTVGSAPYTLVVASVTSNTQLTLSVAFDGPTTSGLAWNAVPASMQVAITQKILNDFAQVARGRILDFQNWQKIYSDDPSVTVVRPDRTQFTGPSWGYMASQYVSKASKGANADITSLSGLTTALSPEQGGTGQKTAGSGWKALLDGRTATTARTDLGLGTAATANVQTSITDTSVGALMGVGAWGIGSTSVTLDDAYYRPMTGFTRTTGVTTALPYGAGFYSTYNGSISFHLSIEGGGNLRFRCLNSGNIAYANTVYHTGNTTRASDGTLKAASPVARIVKCQNSTQRTDVAEEGFEWCGCGVANYEAEGISISRLDTGTYLLTGSAGLATEGWQLLPPRDPMGSGDLGIVEAEQTESGGLRIKLYKRRYIMTDGGEIVAEKGALIDVPANSWIDVRLDMPNDSAYNRKQAGLQILALKDEQQAGS